MKRVILGVTVVGLCALVMVVMSASSAMPVKNSNDPAILEWRTMVAVVTPYFTVNGNPVDGVGGGNARWVISQGWGELRSSGKLEIHTRGLILPDPPFNGVNVVPTFRGQVNCRTIDSSGNAVTVQLLTEPFPASSAGDSDIETTVALPTPCIAPTVFVMHGAAPRWFATLGK